MSRPNVKIKRAKNKIFITKEYGLTATRFIPSGTSDIDNIFGLLSSNDANQEALLATTYDVISGILKELRRQYDKWGNQYHSLPAWEMITAEEYGEWVKAMNDVVYYNGENGSAPTELLDEAIKEGIEMIACATQAIHELVRLRDGATDGEYTSQNKPKS